MGLDGHGHPKPFGEWHRFLEHLGRRLHLSPAGAWFFAQWTAVNANERGFPIVGEFEEPVELGANAFDGDKDHAVDDHNR